MAVIEDQQRCGVLSAELHLHDRALAGATWSSGLPREGKFPDRSGAAARPSQSEAPAQLTCQQLVFTTIASATRDEHAKWLYPGEQKQKASLTESQASLGLGLSLCTVLQLATAFAIPRATPRDVNFDYT